MHLHKEKITDCVSLSVLKINKFKASVISFSITMPLTKERYAYNLLLSHILQRGTKSYPTTALINKKLDELYGSSVEAKSQRVGENISLSISAEILDNKYIADKTDVLGETIKIAAELILFPAFLESNFNMSFFEQEKKIICKSIDSEINSTGLYAAKRCAEIINEQIDLPTSQELKEIISNATFESLVQHREYLINHAPINVFYVGSQDECVVKEKISSAFSSYPCKNATPLIPPRPLTRESVLDLSTKMPVSQGKLSLGLSTGICVKKGDRAFYVATMLNEILGGSASSKLFLNVREKLSLCYHCSSAFSGYSGIIMISSGFDVKNYEIARKAILEQVEEIKQGLISDAEFSAAQRSLCSNYRQISDNPFELQSFFSNRALFDLEDSIENTTANLLSVTKEEIIELASNIKLIASYFVEGTLSADNSDLDEEDENE